jgi:hypothetical protein
VGPGQIQHNATTEKEVGKKGHNKNHPPKKRGLITAFCAGPLKLPGHFRKNITRFKARCAPFRLIPNAPWLRAFCFTGGLHYF